jgi:hypothetical protein
LSLPWRAASSVDQSTRLGRPVDRKRVQRVIRSVSCRSRHGQVIVRAGGVHPRHPPRRVVASGHDRSLDRQQGRVYLHPTIDCCTRELASSSLELRCRDGERSAWPGARGVAGPGEKRNQQLSVPTTNDPTLVTYRTQAEVAPPGGPTPTSYKPSELIGQSRGSTSLPTYVVPAHTGRITHTDHSSSSSGTMKRPRRGVIL